MLVEFLYQIYLNPLIFNEFYNSLSIPQSDGTLKHRFSNLIPPYRLRGKTGTLNGVVSLAGYVTAKSGDLLIFSINFNYSRGNANKLRMLQDKIITLIADSN
jgi:D-alanyl-D-alanine carboxypeptidase/D-alanyl-D-alanine-endopeptidase (penicillin-binding protein 4)